MQEVAYEPHTISRLKMKKNLFVRCALATNLVALSGCGMWQAAKDNEPLPPPPVREYRTLQVPEDLRQSRPPGNPMAAALARSASLSVATAPAPAAAAPVAEASAPAKASPVKGSFTPYFPSGVESAAPNSWTTEPGYDFPWIPGALPTRVNEETTFGAGARMLGRLFAKVTFADEAPVVQAPKVAVVPAKKEDHKSKSSLSRWFQSVMVVDEKPKEPERKTTETVKTASMVVCSGVTCLDSARDMLVTDAEAKGWQMLLNRRVSLHQSFQFRRDDRLVSIELDSDGGKTLAIEYSLMPVQTR